MLVGFINGILVAKIGIPSFIATLGTQFFWFGMAAVLSGGKSYALRGAEESSVWQWLVGRPFAGRRRDWVQQIPIQALWTAIIVVFLWFILNRHRFGEHVLFIGDSNAVSRVVGIDVEREKIKLFTLMGTLAAIAAIMLTLENKNYFGNQGQGYLLIAIASVLIGGTSIFGGRATIVGTVFGCFIIAMVEPGLVATGLTGAWVNTVRGLDLPDRDHLLSLSSTSRSGAAPSSRACCERSAAGRPDTAAEKVRRRREPDGADAKKGRKRMKLTRTLLAGAAAAAVLASAGAASAQMIGEGPDHVHADGRQRRRRRDARPPDRRGAGRRGASASTSRSSSPPGRRRP